MLNALGGANRMMASVLKNSVAFCRGDLLLIDCAHPQFSDLLRQQQNRTALRDAITAVTGKTYRLGPYQKAAPAEAADPLEAFMRHLNGRVPIENLDAEDEA